MLKNRLLLFMKSLTLFFISLVVSINFALQGNTFSPASTGIAPCTIVIFGASGDLTARKLLPALYHLALEGHISSQTAIVGFSKGKHADNTFRVQMSQAIEQFSRTKSIDTPFWDQFKNQIFYHQSDFTHEEGYENLEKLLSNIDQEIGTKGNRIYYLATPPSSFSPIIKKLYEHNLLYDAKGEKDKWSRVIIEKPFGSDLDSAIRLEKEVFHYLHPSQVYLMDHYLGKEGVQNILTLRFENAIFEPLWNNKSIDHVQITLGEDIGIGSRAQFWEETGALRDLLQNHLMQLIATIAMEPPGSLETSHIHEEKIKVLQAIRPFSLEEIEKNVVRAQYGPGVVKGVVVPGYKQEMGVSAHSYAETYIAAKIFIDNDRWEGVPFYIRGGKRLAKQTTEIAIHFKNSNLSGDPVQANVLFIRIQPNPSIFLKVLSKIPMLGKKTNPVLFGYSSEGFFGKTSPEAYEKLLYDAVQGDQSLYVASEEHITAWRLLAPIFSYWKSHPENMQSYEAGTSGPLKADQMLQEDGHHWQLLDN